MLLLNQSFISQNFSHRQPDGAQGRDQAGEDRDDDNQGGPGQDTARRTGGWHWGVHKRQPYGAGEGHTDRNGEADRKKTSSAFR